jgi:hypothetical protein
MIYHHFDNVRSYASVGIADVRSIPPRFANSPLCVAAQCKNTKKGDYIVPAERGRLKWYSETFSYVVVEPFKKNHKVYIKLEPWKLKGKIITPDEFLYKFYGIYADDWKTYRKNWNDGIKRKKILVKPKRLTKLKNKKLEK